MPMQTYTYRVREVWVQTVEVRANSAEEAAAIIADGGGDYIENTLEYSHPLGKETFELIKTKEEVAA